jgi:two-component system, OmpR family, response regulator
MNDKSNISKPSSLLKVILGSTTMALKKILIVDDEDDLRSLLKAFLIPLNYDVFTASTLGEGLKMVPQIKPDIIFLDNNLPDGLGWDKIDVIQQQVPQCKINLISAFKFIPEKLRGRESVRLIEKPISFSMLRQYLD